MSVMKRHLRGIWRCGCGVRTFANSARFCGSAPPFSILFLGTDSFALETLRALHLDSLSSKGKRVVDALHVVSTSTKTAVADFANSHNLRLLTWPLKPSDLDFYDFGILVSFGRMVPRKVIERLPYGILNVHPSLLPRWRGASPVLHTVLNADRETGVSVISIQPSYFDRGPIIGQERTPIPQDTSTQSLANTLAARGADLLMAVLRGMPGILDTASPQADDAFVTYAHKVRSGMAWINWDQHSTRQIRQQYLALSHVLPLRSVWNDQTVKLTDMVLDTDDGFVPSTLPPLLLTPHRRQGERSGQTAGAGAVTFDPCLQALCVKCRNGWVAFRSIVLRKLMSAGDFHNGYLSKDKRPDVRFQSVANGLFDDSYWDFVGRPKVGKS